MIWAEGQELLVNMSIVLQDCRLTFVKRGMYTNFAFCKEMSVIYVFKIGVNMNYEKITMGNNAPDEVNVLIEIPMNGGAIKYEFDKDSAAIWVDRFINTSMQYPCNYGFIPHTLAGDGDPVDVLVYTNAPLHPGVVIAVKPVGVLITKDENGEDEKVLAVPTRKLDPFFAGINEYSDLPEILLNKIEHFFARYKDLEKGKWVEIKGWAGSLRAKEVIMAAKR